MALEKMLGRTLSSLKTESLLTHHFERAIMLQDWPEEYPIKVYNKERKWDGYFHPSSDATADPLFLYYKFHPDFHLQQERLDPTTVMTFQIGSALHAMMQSMLIHIGFTSEEFVEVQYVNEEIWSSGTTDVQRAWTPSHPDPFPVEIKSAQRIPNKPIFANKVQFNIYLDNCDPEHGPYEYGSLLYVEKPSPHRIKDFIVYRDESLLDEVYTKWDNVMQAIANGDPSTLRDCCMPNTIQHRQCPANGVCRIGPPEMKVR